GVPLRRYRARRLRGGARRRDAGRQQSVRARGGRLADRASSGGPAGGTARPATAAGPVELTARSRDAGEGLVVAAAARGLRFAPRRVDGFADLLQPGAGLAIDQPVPAFRAKAPLKCRDADLYRGGADAIADARQIREGGGPLDDPDAAAAAAGQIGRRRGPQPD